MWSPGIFKILLLCVLLTLKLQIDVGYTYIAEKSLPSVIGLTDFFIGHLHHKRILHQIYKTLKIKALLL